MPRPITIIHQPEIHAEEKHRNDDHIVVACTSLQHGDVTFFISVRTSL